MQQQNHEKMPDVLMHIQTQIAMKKNCYYNARLKPHFNHMYDLHYADYRLEWYGCKAEG